MSAKKLCYIVGLVFCTVAFFGLVANFNWLAGALGFAILAQLLA